MKNHKQLKVIAEVAQGFEGDLTRTKLFVRAASMSGADAVKFQLVYADELSTKKYKYYELFKSLEMSNKNWKEVNNYSKSLGIELIVDVFGPKSLNTAKNLNLNSIKIHGTDITNVDLLNKVSNTDIRSIILGVGGSSMQEIKRAVKILSKKEIVLLVGFQGYPTKTNDNLISRINLIRKSIREIHNDFTLGFASHPDENDNPSLVSLVSIGAGAKCLERHLTLGKVMKLEDYESALNPDEFSSYVKDVKLGYTAMGHINNYSLSSSETKYRKSIRRDVVASKNIKKGTKLSSTHLQLKRTGLQGGLKVLEQAYGKILQKDLRKDETILTSYLR